MTMTVTSPPLSPDLQMPTTPDLKINSGQDGGSSSTSSSGDMPVTPQKYADVTAPDIPEVGDESGSNNVDTSNSQTDVALDPPPKDATLTPPPAEDPDHKDLEIQVGDSKSLEMRWDKSYGYVVTGEKNGTDPVKPYTPEEFKENNKGLLVDGGGKVPDVSDGNPEYFGPDNNGQSLIYRHDPDTDKNVVVGVRKDGERNYFQTRSTMDFVNQSADKEGWTTPEPPLKAPGKHIPEDSENHDGWLNTTGPATNGEAQISYVWRYDSTAGRYCAVGQTEPGNGDFRMYDESEYLQKNSGDGALRQDGSGTKAPAVDPNQPEYVDTQSKQILLSPKSQEGDQSPQTEEWGQPIYQIDRDTGNKVIIGIEKTDKSEKDDSGNKVKGATERLYFDVNDMHLYNGGLIGSFDAKDLKDLPSKYVRDAPNENDNPEPAQFGDYGDPMHPGSTLQGH